MTTTPAPAGRDTSVTDRLLDGLTSAIVERGYRDSTVADVVRHARTSKRTFYEQFASKEQCLIELLRRNNSDLIARITTTVRPDADWHLQIRQAVDAYVEHIGARPAITLCWIREAPALGAASRPLHRQVMRDLTGLLVSLTGNQGFRQAGIDPITAPMALILLGGLRELTALFVEDERDVRGLADPAVAAATALVSAR
ncbi:TetR/AcrR family transcriptional regulator [Mycobacterium sp. NAZ190054]|uniref:TetR/AcrR family transcriptional regulator n=1 Tax=Mycobacterium sp. NAZ190054 TaxID=1747766 RepID=UPI000799F648|nr:TetR/AcrR family transcriptional regulator [Mycobacterium sp. NAZ190054]KWX65517.1 TetR family transcriptional regulator [Mycobacterium sp. NAZ190054]